MGVVVVVAVVTGCTMYMVSSRCDSQILREDLLGLPVKLTRLWWIVVVVHSGGRLGSIVCDV